MTRLFTPRLALRPFSEADVQRLLGMTGGAQVLSWLVTPERRAPAQPPAPAAWLSALNADHARGAGTRFAIELAASVPVEGTRAESMPGAFVGTVGLSASAGGAELWVWLLPRYWSRGLAQEAVHAICAHAFRPLPAPYPASSEDEEDAPPGLGLSRIAAYTAPGNARSQSMLQRVGFAQVTHRDHFPGREKGTGRQWELLPAALRAPPPRPIDD